MPAIAAVALPLLGRRRCPFAGPLAVWLLGAALSLVDGRVVASTQSTFAAGLAAAFLLGNLCGAAERVVGLAVVLGSALLIVYDDPVHALG